MSVPELVLAYNRANRQAAILCNHQRTVPKSFDASMSKMTERVRPLRTLIVLGPCRTLSS